MSACNGGNLGVVRLLLARDDVYVNDRDKDQHTALMVSCVRGYIEIVRCLLDQDDIDVNLEDSNHKTALMLACDNDHTEVISTLLQREDLQRTTRNLEVIKYFVMKLRRVKKKDIESVIETAVSRNLPYIALLSGF